MKFTKDGRIVMSDSMMKTYQDCGARFWFTYCENPEEMPRIPALEFGSVVHDMFYDFFRRKNPSAKMYTSAQNFANVFRGKWFGIDAQPKTERGKRKPPILWRSPDEKEKLLGMGYNICRDFYDRNENVPFSHVLVEQYFMVSLTNERNGKGYALQGYIDRIELKDATFPPSHNPADLGKAIKEGNDGVLWVVDYKSGYKPVSEHALNLDTQFSCYDLAVEILFPFRQRRFAIDNVRDGSYTLTSRSEGERRVLRERIFHLGKNIEKEKYPLASNMYKCASCLYIRHCNSLQKKAHEKGIHPEDLMKASAPLKGRRNPARRMFEWKDGEIIRTDDLLLKAAEKQSQRPVQLSFFVDSDELDEINEDAEFSPSTTAHVVERAIEWDEPESA